MPNTDSPHWQEISQSNEPLDYDPQLTDEERIAELESTCAKPMVQMDRQARVVDATQQWWSRSKYSPEHYLDHENSLGAAVDAYEQQMAQLAKKKGGGWRFTTLR